MFKIFYLLFIVVIITGLGLTIHSNTYAASEAVLSEFTITVTKIEASTDGGTTYTTLFDGEANMDIAATSIDAKAYTFPVNTEIPLGSTINKVRVTIDDQLSFTGYFSYDATSSLNGGGFLPYWYHEQREAAYSALANGAATALASTTVPSPGKVEVTAIPDIACIATLDANVSVQENQNTPLKLNFNLSIAVTASAIESDYWVFPNYLTNYCSVGE